jgi:general secretion pathway protein N
VKDPSAASLKRLRLGDEHAGWSVKDILPDRLVLERQGETNELLLRDFSKAQPAPGTGPAPAAQNPPARPPPAGQAQPPRRPLPPGQVPSGKPQVVPPRPPTPRPNAPRPPLQQPR